MVVHHHICAFFFKKCSDIRSRITRNCNDLNISKCGTSLAQRSFRYRGTKVWNTIAEEIRNSRSLTTFKGKVKNWFLQFNSN